MYDSNFSFSVFFCLKMFIIYIYIYIYSYIYLKKKVSKNKNTVWNHISSIYVTITHVWPITDSMWIFCRYRLDPPTNFAAGTVRSYHLRIFLPAAIMILVIFLAALIPIFRNTFIQNLFYLINANDRMRQGP